MKFTKETALTFIIELTPTEEHIKTKIKDFLHVLWPNHANAIMVPTLNTAGDNSRYILNLSAVDQVNSQQIALLESHLINLCRLSHPVLATLNFDFFDAWIDSFLQHKAAESYDFAKIANVVEVIFREKMGTKLLEIKNADPDRFYRLDDSYKTYVSTPENSLPAQNIREAALPNTIPVNKRVVRCYKSLTRDNPLHELIMLIIITLDNPLILKDEFKKIVHANHEYLSRGYTLIEDILFFIDSAKQLQIYDYSGRMPTLVELTGIKILQHKKTLISDHMYFESVIAPIFNTRSLLLRKVRSLTPTLKIIFALLVEFAIVNEFNILYCTRNDELTRYSSDESERIQVWNLFSLDPSYNACTFLRLLTVNHDIVALQKMLTLQHSLLYPSANNICAHKVQFRIGSKTIPFNQIFEIIENILSSLLVKIHDKTTDTPTSFLIKIYDTYPAIGYLFHYISNLRNFSKHKKDFTVDVVPIIDLVKNELIVAHELFNLLQLKPFDISFIKIILQLPPNIFPLLSKYTTTFLIKFFSLVAKEHKLELMKWLHQKGFRLQTSHLIETFINDFYRALQPSNVAFTFLMSHCVENGDIQILLQNLLSLPVNDKPKIPLYIIFQIISNHLTNIETDFKAKIKPSYLRLVASNYLLTETLNDPLSLCTNTLFNATDLCSMTAISKEYKSNNSDEPWHHMVFFSTLFRNGCKILFDPRETALNCTILKNIFFNEHLVKTLFQHGFKITPDMINQNNPLFHPFNEIEIDMFKIERYFDLLIKYSSPDIIKSLLSSPASRIIPPHDITQSVTFLMLLVAIPLKELKHGKSIWLISLIKKLIALGADINEAVDNKTALDWCRSDTIRKCLREHQAVKFKDLHKIAKCPKRTERTDGQEKAEEEESSTAKKSKQDVSITNMESLAPHTLLGRRSPKPSEIINPSTLSFPTRKP